MSDYNYSRKLGQRGTIEQCGTFESFVSYLASHPDSYFVNTQARITYFRAEWFEQRLVSEQLLLLPMDRFDEACLLLQQMFPEDFKDVSYTKANVNRRRQDTDFCALHEFARLEILSQDYDLYARANLQFEALCEKYLESTNLARLLRLHRLHWAFRRILLAPLVKWCERFGKFPSYLRLP